MKKSPVNIIVTTYLISSVPGIIIGLLIMSIAYDHNPQGEFHSNGNIHWGELLPLGIAWALCTTLFLGTLVSASILMYKKIRSFTSDE